MVTKRGIDQRLLHRFLLLQGSGPLNYSEVKKLFFYWNINRGLPISEKWIRDFSRNICLYSVGQSSRATIENLISDLSFNQLKHTSYFLNRLLAAMGFYRLAESLFRISAQNYIDRALVSKREADLLEGFRAASGIGDLELINELGTKILGTRNIGARDIYDDVSRYLKICGLVSYDMNLNTHSDVNFASNIFEKSVYVIGPAPVQINKDIQMEFQGVIVRRLGVNSTTFGSDDGFDGRCDIGYVDKLFLENLNKGGETLDLSHLICLAITQELETLPSGENFRIARNPNSLFFAGGTNKIPLMLYDLLAEQPDVLHLSGTSFYASSVAYSESNRDTGHNGLKIGPRGTTSDHNFEACNMLAAHNPFTNRNFVKNMLGNKSFKPDESVMAILNLTDAEYAAELDKLYGEARR